jgi:hypothetical protein
MNRVEKRQEKREHEKQTKINQLEAKGFTVSKIEYLKKRNIANRKCSNNTPEEEKEEREESAQAAIKVYRRTFPTLLKRLSKIKDTRQTKKIKHSLTVLMLYGIFMFVHNMSSLRNANKEISSAIFFENMKAIFPEFETMPHADTLGRLLETIDVNEIEKSMLDLFEHLATNKKFRNNLINKRYVIAIDGTQKFKRDEKWSKECLSRHVGAEKKEQYYVYVLEAVIILDNGMTLPLMSEFLDSDEYRNVINNKQDCERKAFYRIAKRIKERFPKLKVAVTMDGLYACGPIIRTCKDYGWDFMLVFKEGCMSNTWKDAMGLIRLTPENVLNCRMGNRDQTYKWINAVEHFYGDNGMNRVTFDVAICEETWEEVSRRTGEIESKSTRYVWVSGKKLTKTNIEYRSIKIGRYRWKIENNFLVLKHQGYEYEHCFSYNWNAMVGFHHLMNVGRFINVLIANSELFQDKVNVLGIRGLLEYIFKAFTSDVLYKSTLAIKDDSYQWRLVS